MRGVYGKAPVFANSLAVCFGHVRGENEDEFKTQSFKYFKRSNFELLKKKKRIQRLKNIIKVKSQTGS